MTLKRSGVAAVLVASLVLAVALTASRSSATTVVSIQEVRFATPGVAVLDLSRNFSFPAINIVPLGVEQLMKFSPSGKLQPSLATSVRQPNPTTYIYRLRSGVKFWNGATMTANDVVASMNRYRKPKSQLANFYQSVRSISRTGPLEVTVRLKRADSNWRYAPAIAAPIIENKFALAHEADIGAPGVLTMGTGPWRLSSFTLGKSIEFVRNDDWWGGTPSIDKVTIPILPDDAAISLALRAGQIDGFFTQGGRSRSLKNIPGTKQTVVAGNDLMYISMNTQTGPWADIHVRRAVAHLIDRPAIVRSVLGGFGKPLDAMLPPGLLGLIATPSELKSAYRSYRKYAYSLELARKEMALSKYPNGFSATWSTTPDSDQTRVLQVVAANMSKIGIKITLKQKSGAQWLAEYYGPRNKIGIIHTGFGVTYPAPSYFLDSMYDSANARAQGFNVANFVNKSVDRSLGNYRVAQSPSAQVKNLVNVLKIGAEQVPYVTLFSQSDTLTLSNKYRMKNFTTLWKIRNWALDISPA